MFFFFQYKTRAPRVVRNTARTLCDLCTNCCLCVLLASLTGQLQPFNLYRREFIVVGCCCCKPADMVYKSFAKSIVVVKFIYYRDVL